MIAHHGPADCFAHDKPGARAGTIISSCQVDDDGSAARAPALLYCCGEIGASPQSRRRRQHRISTCFALRAQPRTAATAARRNDGAAGTGTHAQPKAVVLGTTTVVRLEGTLTHGWFSTFNKFRSAWIATAQANSQRTGSLIILPAALSGVCGASPHLRDALRCTVVDNAAVIHNRLWITFNVLCKSHDPATLPYPGLLIVSAGSCR